MITKKVSDFTTHNVSSPANYTQANNPLMFSGNTNHDGVVSAVDPTLMDDSENAASPMVVSKESIRTLMPVGWAGRMAIHAQLWWGLTSHPNIGMNMRDLPTMTGICADLVARGFDFLIADWYHYTITTVLNDASLNILASACLATGLNFAIMIDEQFFGKQGSTPATEQADIISAINHLLDNYASHPRYEHYVYNGVSRPIIALWDVASVAGSNVNWSTVKSSIASHGNPLVIQYQASGFSVAGSDGALAWVDTNADTTLVPSGTNYLTNSFLPAAAANPTKINISSFIKGFNGTDTKSTSWSLGKYLAQRQGQTFLDWIAVNAAWSLTHRLDILAGLTLDDYQEGTALQCGIRTDVTCTASAVGNLISFSITGNENTVRKYNLWGTVNGVDVGLYASVFPGATKQFDLASLGLDLGVSYTFYIEVQSMPMLQNHMAPQTFTYFVALPSPPDISFILSADVGMDGIVGAASPLLTVSLVESNIQPQISIPAVIEIPLQPTPQLLGVTLNSIDYKLRVVWNDQNQSWVMDIMDANNNAIAMGLPLVTSNDLLEQLEYLGIGGQMLVQTDFYTTDVPTFENLGSTGHLYFASAGIPIVSSSGFPQVSQGSTSPSSSGLPFSTIPFSATPVFAGLPNTDMVFQITLTGNVTSSTITGLTAGAHVTFIIIQDDAGSRTFAWPSNVQNAQTVGTSPNERDVQEFVWDGSNAWPISMMTNN